MNPVIGISLVRLMTSSGQSVTATVRVMDDPPKDPPIKTEK